MQKIKMDDKANNMTVRDGYLEFKRYCEIRNYSGYTVEHYNDTIHNFELFWPIDNDIGTHFIHPCNLSPGNRPGRIFLFI